MKQLVRRISEKVLWLNGDEPGIKSLFQNATSTALGSLIGDHRVVIIDEAQRIQNIGINLKLLVDNYPYKQIIATGSPVFDWQIKLMSRL